MNQQREPPVQDSAADHRDWAVYQCPHGCVHVRIDNVTLTFDEPEFHRLVHLLGDAYVRLATRKVVMQTRPH